jgi:hypothetical protein
VLGILHKRQETTYEMDARNLNNKVIFLNNKPKIIPRSKECDVLNEPAKNIESLKLVKPVKLYKIDDPNRRKADEKAPNIKYLRPDSVENSEVLLKIAKT